MMGLVVRHALVSDTSAACDLVRRSIAELCSPDHGNDERTVAEWLGNKTPENFASWITSNRHVALIAELDDVIAGFALLNRRGSIALLYVAPQCRFRGVSKALLDCLEKQAIALGLTELKVESSATALSFYERCGYLPAGDVVDGFGITHAYPLLKSIAL